MNTGISAIPPRSAVSINANRTNGRGPPYPRAAYCTVPSVSRPTLYPAVNFIKLHNFDSQVFIWAQDTDSAAPTSDIVRIYYGPNGGKPTLLLCPGDVLFAL